MIINRHHEYQMNKLRELARHAAAHSPYYKDQSWASRARMGLPVNLSEIPITPKEHYKSDNEAFFADHVPKEDGKILKKYTSGSTGEPSLVLSTQRAVHMHRMDVENLAVGWGFGTYKGVVRVTVPKKGPKKLEITRTKGEFGEDEWTIKTLASTPILNLLRETRAEQLQCFPHIALAILEDAPDIDFLRLIVTLGETVPDELLRRVSQMPGCRHFDTLTAEDAGILAGKCAHCGNYHPATTHAIIEILDDEGMPAMAGTMGRVIVTPLYNFAMPLLRYDIGDRVMLAPENDCTHGQVSIKSIVGRDRDMFKLPGGGRVNASFSAQDGYELGLRKAKLVQIAIDRVEIRYIPLREDAVLSQADAQELLDRISPQLTAIPVKVDEIPTTAAGKYIMHECHI